MAIPETIKFTNGVFYLGDGAATEVFTKICGAQSGEVTVSKDTNDAAIADCDDSSAPIWKVTDVVSQGWTMKFEGLATVAALTLIEAATLTPATRGVRLRLIGAGAGGATPDKQYAGKAHITHALNGSLGERFKISVEIVGDGALAVTSVAAL